MKRAAARAVLRIVGEKVALDTGDFNSHVVIISYEKLDGGES